MIQQYVLAAILASASIASVARAEDVTLDQTIAMYRAHSPRLAAQRASIGVAQADVIDAGIYPNPSLSLSTASTVRGTDTIGHTQLTGGIDIPLLVGGQRGKRSAAANRHVDVARAELAITQAEAELAIRGQYNALLEAQEKTTLLAAALTDAQSLRAIVAGRTTAGASSEYSVQRIDLAIAAIASRAQEATSDERIAAGALALAVGVPTWQPHAIGSLATAEGPFATRDDHPALRRDRAAITAARADEDRAHADAVPTPSLGVQTFGTTDPSGLVVGVGLSIPLPLFDRNQGAVARARAETQRASLELAAHEAELTSAAAIAQRTLADRQATLATYETDAVARITKVRAMAESAYRSGQGGIVELLDALDATTDVRLRELELRGSVVEAALELRRAAQGQ